MYTFANPLTQKITDFLARIGIVVRSASLHRDTFLPGVDVVNGELVVDESALLFPGDLLHEAGHLALLSSSERADCQGDLAAETDTQSNALEVAAMAWSFAAALAAGVDPAEVFHDGGYHGRAKHLLGMFRMGAYLGLPPLVQFGLTQMSQPPSQESYPHMLKWLRD